MWTERFREWLSAEVFKPLQRLLHHVHEVGFRPCTTCMLMSASATELWGCYTLVMLIVGMCGSL